MILYPATRLHRARPVSRGSRIASFSWIQSMVRDDGERTLLFDLDSAIQQLRAPRQIDVIGVILVMSATAAALATMTDAQSWNALARSQLSVDASSGEVVRWEPYDGTTRGQKWRGWVRFGHTGELGGITGQLLAGTASLGGVVPMWTGLALAMRRLLGWRLWRRVRAPQADVPPAVAPLPE
jgi:uncharacterized iron-regulated membrane protein